MANEPGLVLQADDSDVDASAAVDLGDDFLTPEEVQYYLNLPDLKPTVTQASPPTNPRLDR